MTENTSTQLTDKIAETKRLVEDKTGVPLKYLVAGAIAVAAFSLLAKGKKKRYSQPQQKDSKPGFIRQYVTPLIVAAASKKLMEIVETALKQREHQQQQQPHAHNTAVASNL